MDRDQLENLLKRLRDGETSVAEAMQRLRRMPFEATSIATIDHHRAIRCGQPEVIFCQGKTVEQVVEIARRMRNSGSRVFATRADESQLRALREAFPEASVNDLARAVLIEDADADMPADDPPFVVVVCAGTADLPVAEEAAMTLRAMRVPCRRLTDVGVAGLHRLLAHLELLHEACVVVVVAGMEGALPSVVGGLVDCPVFAVPTSVGYGASFEGLAALLGMVNSCASNVTVVNIDNGFSAACTAAAVHRQIRRCTSH